jgi:hypothetical protein
MVVAVSERRYARTAGGDRRSPDGDGLEDH